AAAFLFFILASAPHQVHHVFKPHKTPDNCLVYSLAQGCHAAGVAAIPIQAPEQAIAYVAIEPDLPTVRFGTAPFSARAPPAA
ncbi:MAG TPA: hypothetical protein VGH50_08685, partial [Candidatus Binatia bacterium]